MAWKYILFDLDGTLTDPSVGILNCIKYALEAMEEDVPDRSTLLRFIGPPLIDGFQELTGMDYSDALTATVKYRERYSVIGLFENEPYEGITLSLSRLKSQGKVLALATSKPESYAVRILQYFNMKKYFDVTVGSTMDSTRSRKDQVIQEIFRRLKLGEEEKKHVIMVGDRKHDIEGARECGIASMGVCYGFGGQQELEEAGADYVVQNVGEMMMLLADKDGLEDGLGNMASAEKEIEGMTSTEKEAERMASLEKEMESILSAEESVNEETIHTEEKEKTALELLAEAEKEVENDVESQEEPEPVDEAEPVEVEPEPVTLFNYKYTRIDFDEAGARLQKLFEGLQEAKNAEEQFAIHQEYYRLRDHIDTMAVLASFRHSANTIDEFYDRENDYYDERLPVFENQETAYYNVLLHSPYRPELEKMIGSVAFCNMELQMKSNHPRLIPLQQEENRLVSEYEKLLASARFEWGDEVLSMSGLGKYLTAVDRDTRKKAWQMLQDFMAEHEDRWDEIYDELVRNRNQQALEMGYPNYLSLGYYRMRRNCYGKEEIRAFRQQVKEDLVPFVTRLQEKRKERLGIDELYLYDNGLYYREGNPAPKVTPEQIMENGRKMYSEMSPETAEFMQKMMAQEMFDILGRPNKRQGGYMDYLPEMGMPLVFANFNGTSGDVDVITHECGHAFQGYLSGGDAIREHRDITMETAEVHSMSMEFFADPWMDLFFGEDADKFCRMQIEDALCFIPYGCMVDEFQEIIYEYPQLSKGERHEVWKRLEKQYRPHLHLEGLPFFEKGGWWQRQPHIYASPFYYIDYCLAQVCALQYKILMDKDYQAAWRSYLQLCKLSASGFFTDMLQEVGLLSPFQKGFIKKLEHHLEKFIFPKDDTQKGIN